MSNLSFKQWYDSEFRDGISAASALTHEISEVAALIGVNWSAVESRITWESGKAGKVNAYGSSLLKGFKNSVGIYASIERCRKTDAEFPTITFKNKGGNGESETFFGLTYLYERYNEFKKIPISPQEISRREKQRREREDKLARQQAAAKHEHEIEQKRRAANVDKELKKHNMLPRAVSFVYTDKKAISAILNHVDARQGADEHGNYISLLLKNIDGQPVGCQRIYDRHITKPNGSKTNKDFTWGMDKDGAHLVLGDLHTAERIITVEGFATGASIFLALIDKINVCVIITLDAGNMVKVVDAYKAKHPDMQMDHGLDNDQWKCKQGKGNTGVLVGYQLLTNYKNDRAFLPNFEKVDNVFQATDWNDLHVYAGLKAVKEQLTGRKNQLQAKGNLFEVSLNRLKFISKQQIMKEAKACASLGMTFGLPLYTPAEVVNLIKMHTQHMKDSVNIKTISEHVNKIFKAKINDAKSFRSFTRAITDDKQRPEHITYKKFNTSKIDDEILDYIESIKGGITIVRMPMGSGKTQRLIKPIMWQNERSAFFAHRVSLIGGAVDALSKDKPDHIAPITHYQDPNVRDMLPGSNKLACCVNSAIKGVFAPLLDNLHAACIDEAAQTLRHTTSGGAVKYPVAVFNKILNMCATARDQVILADADANDTLVEFCEIALKMRNAHLKELYGEDYPEQKIHIVDGVTDCSDIDIYYSDGDTVYKRAAQDIANGLKTLVACDSAATGEKLYNQMQLQKPDLKGLFIDSESKPSHHVQEFLDAPDSISMQYDYIIYSPAISSGVSIENGYFEKHYGIFCGTIAPSDAIQMIRRDRNAKEFVLGLSTMHSAREESALNMWLGMILANDNELDVNLNKETGKIEITTDDYDFDRFRLELIAQENKAKNSFASNLLYILFDDKYKLHKLDASDVEQEIGKSMKDASREMLKAIDYQRHLDQNTPSESEYKALQEKRNLSKEEKAQINRYKIENQLMMDVDEESVDFHHRGGLRKARLFELLQMKADTAVDIDDAELKADIKASNRLYIAKQRQALRDFFEIAGFDHKTGQGVATQESLTAAIKHLTDGDNIHMFNNVYGFGGYVNPFSKNLNAVNKAKQILEAIGAKLNVTQLGRLQSDSASRQRYTIDCGMWDVMDSMHSKRTEAKVSSFNLEHLQCMIHVSHDNYIDNVENLDQEKTSKTKASSWMTIFKQASENLRIPLKSAPKVLKKLRDEGYLGADIPEQGAQSIISRIYHEIIGHLQQKNT